VRVVLTWHLLFWRQDCFNITDFDVNHERTRALLNFTSDNVLNFGFEFTVKTFISETTDTLGDDLLGCSCCNTTKIVWSLVDF
jgi:hypothetical protein